MTISGDLILGGAFSGGGAVYRAFYGSHYLKRAKYIQDSKLSAIYKQPDIYHNPKWAGFLNPKPIKVTVY